MSARFVVALSALAVGATAAPAAAQFSSGPTPRVIDVTPYVGYMMFGDFIDGPLGTNIGIANGPLYGAQLGLTVAPNVAIVGNIAYASADLKIGVPIIGGITVGSSDVLLYDGSLQLSMPMGPASPIKPFAQAGAGAIRYRIENGLLDVSATNLAFNIGGGIDYQVTPSIAVRAMVKDYIGKFDFEDATTFDLKGKTANNVALSLGVKLGF